MANKTVLSLPNTPSCDLLSIFMNIRHYSLISYPFSFGVDGRFIKLLSGIVVQYLLSTRSIFHGHLVFGTSYVNLGIKYVTSLWIGLYYSYSNSNITLWTLSGRQNLQIFRQKLNTNDGLHTFSINSYITKKILYIDQKK